MCLDRITSTQLQRNIILIKKKGATMVHSGMRPIKEKKK